MHIQALRQPAMLVGSTHNHFMQLFTDAFYNKRADRITIGQLDDVMFFRPHKDKVEALIEVNKLWWKLCYDEYRNNNFEPHKDVSVTLLHCGVIYRDMFPYDTHPDEYGFFRFKLNGTFTI